MANPIPDFDYNQVLPPHRGNPSHRHDLSPYPCTSLEFCEKYSFTPERIELLQGFLKFREQLRSHGLKQGYQWIDGSFLEDIEHRENRAPQDIDILTIYWGYDAGFQSNLLADFPEIADRTLCKQNYRLDHFPVDASFSPESVVEVVRYWVQLFSHNRDAVWKGMLKIDLDTAQSDSDAHQLLIGKTP